ncbi:MAG: VacJ family lipoprotein [Burkholderiales bacterium]|nr:VacJ family lipoprotein [Burkholderiales bacterium]
MWVTRVAALCAAAAALGGCATPALVDPRDPFEPANRAVFEFNEGLDRTVIKPVAQVYRAVLPQPVRTGVRNFYGNLWDPWIGVNNLLQGKVEWAMSDMFRFAVNTTFGLGGINDVATDMRLEKHNEDFGQTLGRWGIEPGPYLVLPVLGPSTVRDGVGLIADTFGYLPWRIPTWRKWNHYVAWRNSLTALGFVSLRATLLDAESVVEEAALDKYSFVRDAYLQRRRSLIYDGEPPPEPAPEHGGNTALPDDLATEPSRAVAPAWAARAAPADDTGGGRAPGAFAPGALQLVDPRIPANYVAVLAAAGRPHDERKEARK